MRHLATIREIASLRPIAGADRIEVAQVDGWECVVQKGEFHSKGKSVVRKEQKREGVVMRNVQSNISFKVINPDFLLAEKD